jgi:hypothetical protein
MKASTPFPIPGFIRLISTSDEEVHLAIHDIRKIEPLYLSSVQSRTRLTYTNCDIQVVDNTVDEIRRLIETDRKLNK